VAGEPFAAKKRARPRRSDGSTPSASQPIAIEQIVVLIVYTTYSSIYLFLFE
jgi:hypothetical protein